MRIFCEVCRDVFGEGLREVFFRRLQHGTVIRLSNHGYRRDVYSLDLVKAPGHDGVVCKIRKHSIASTLPGTVQREAKSVCSAKASPSPMHRKGNHTRNYVTCAIQPDRMGVFHYVIDCLDFVKI